MVNCPLCGDTFHDDPDTEPDLFGLVCPGDKASDEVKDAYREALRVAFAEWVATEARSMAELDEKIQERKRRWYERQRTEVTHHELQEDCDERVPVVREQIEAEANVAVEQFDVDPPHLAVPAEILPQSNAELRMARQKAFTSDYLMYVDPPQGPEPYAGPDYPDFFPTNDEHH